MEYEFDIYGNLKKEFWKEGMQVIFYVYLVLSEGELHFERNNGEERWFILPNNMELDGYIANNLKGYKYSWYIGKEKSELNPRSAITLLKPLIPGTIIYEEIDHDDNAVIIFEWKRKGEKNEI